MLRDLIRILCPALLALLIYGALFGPHTQPNRCHSGSIEDTMTQCGGER